MVKKVIAKDVESMIIIDHRPIFRKGLKITLESICPSVEVMEADFHEEFEGIIGKESKNIFFIGVGNLTDHEVVIQVNKILFLNKFSKIAFYDYRNYWSNLLQFLDNKIHGCLKENFDENELIECVKYLKNDLVYLSNEIVSYLIHTRINKPATSKKLSNREREVAQCLVNGMSVTKIAQVMERQISTISTMKKNIQKKLNVDNVIDLAKALHTYKIQH